ncbi:MAG: hypothetical protein E4H09_03145 [Spirochaetales bacterium]|nr:MAG: hypothetical protein E4H09_03145 [Spirochaetales bacterium]
MGPSPVANGQVGRIGEPHDALLILRYSRPRRSDIRTLFALFLSCLFVASAYSDAPQYSANQRETGTIILAELSIRDGILSFRTDSGGCTDATSFVVDILAQEEASGLLPVYALTIRRVRPDDCKAFLSEGVLIEFDLAEDLGLSGAYSVVVTNPVSGKPVTAP